MRIYEDEYGSKKKEMEDFGTRSQDAERTLLCHTEHSPRHPWAKGKSTALKQPGVVLWRNIWYNGALEVRRGRESSGYGQEQVEEE